MGPNVINEITFIAHVMIQVLSMPAKVAVVAVDPISVVGKRPGSRFILFYHEAVLLEGNRLRNYTPWSTAAGVRLEILRMLGQWDQHLAFECTLLLLRPILVYPLLGVGLLSIITRGMRPLTHARMHRSCQHLGKGLLLILFCISKCTLPLVLRSDVLSFPIDRYLPLFVCDAPLDLFQEMEWRH